MFKVIDRNARKRHEICSKLTLRVLVFLFVTLKAVFVARICFGIFGKTIRSSVSRHCSRWLRIMLTSLQYIHCKRNCKQSTVITSLCFSTGTMVTDNFQFFSTSDFSAIFDNWSQIRIQTIAYLNTIVRAKGHKPIVCTVVHNLNMLLSNIQKKSLLLLPNQQRLIRF